MEKRNYMKPLMKRFIIETTAFLAASPENAQSKPTSSISFSEDVTNGDNDGTDPWGDVDYIR